MGIYTELSGRLKAKGVIDSSYSINDSPNDNTYCIQDTGYDIQVFYSERGLKLDAKEFTSSKAAIEYFESWIIKDPTVFKTFNGKI
ncbi:MAG: hypothetical protein ACJAQS_001298 [Porticoccus sp.]|jgi:hypothetical protein